MTDDRSMISDPAARSTGRSYCHYCFRLVAVDQVVVKISPKGRRMYQCLNCQNNVRKGHARCAGSKGKPLTE